MEKSVKGLIRVTAAGAVFSLVLGLAACAPQVGTSASGSPDESSGAEGVEVVWSADADCSTCHLAEEQSTSDSSCLASFHAASDCVSCHPVNEKLEKVHDGVSSGDKMPTKLKKTDASQEACQSCHGSYEDLAAKTAGYQGLVDENGTVVNPHDLPDTTDHQNIICSDCHKMHAADADPAGEAMSTCMGCHHEGVFECGTCHN